MEEKGPCTPSPGSSGTPTTPRGPDGTPSSDGNRTTSASPSTPTRQTTSCGGGRSGGHPLLLNVPRHTGAPAAVKPNYMDNVKGVEAEKIANSAVGNGFHPVGDDHLHHAAPECDSMAHALQRDRPGGRRRTPHAEGPRNSLRRSHAEINTGPSQPRSMRRPNAVSYTHLTLPTN